MEFSIKYVSKTPLLFFDMILVAQCLLSVSAYVTVYLLPGSKTFMPRCKQDTGVQILFLSRSKSCCTQMPLETGCKMDKSWLLPELAHSLWITATLLLSVRGPDSAEGSAFP